MDSRFRLVEQKHFQLPTLMTSKPYQHNNADCNWYSKSIWFTFKLVKVRLGGLFHCDSGHNWRKPRNRVWSCHWGCCCHGEVFIFIQFYTNNHPFGNHLSQFVCFAVPEHAVLLCDVHHGQLGNHVLLLHLLALFLPLYLFRQSTIIIFNDKCQECDLITCVIIVQRKYIDCFQFSLQALFSSQAPHSCLACARSASPASSSPPPPARGEAAPPQ